MVFKKGVPSDFFDKAWHSQQIILERINYLSLGGPLGTADLSSGCSLLNLTELFCMCIPSLHK